MIRFIVDSTFGTTKEFADKNSIKIVSLKLILDGVVTDEGFMPEWDDFYDRFKKSTTFPSTSQPNPEAFCKAIDEIFLEDVNAEIIILTISAGLSGTINSARLAAEGYNGKSIAVIDSQNASGASLLMLEELIEYSHNNTLDDTINYANTLIEKSSIRFIPDTMKYLKKGGRIGTLSALFASIISVKPIFEYKKGAVSIPAKILGFSKAVSEMIKRLPKSLKKLVVYFIGDKKNVPLVLQKVENLLGIASPEVKSVSPVFGIHVGIGAVGIACVEN